MVTIQSTKKKWFKNFQTFSSLLIKAAVGRYVDIARYGHTVVFKCGGTIISEFFVMTAAHCIQLKVYIGDMVVRVGTVSESIAYFDLIYNAFFLQIGICYSGFAKRGP